MNINKQEGREFWCYIWLKPNRKVTARETDFLFDAKTQPTLSFIPAPILLRAFHHSLITKLHYHLAVNAGDVNVWSTDTDISMTNATSNI